jgi:hypothetical protein
MLRGALIVFHSLCLCSTFCEALAGCRLLIGETAVHLPLTLLLDINSISEVRRPVGSEECTTKSVTMKRAGRGAI